VFLQHSPNGGDFGKKRHQFGKADEEKHWKLLSSFINLMPWHAQDHDNASIR